LTEILGVKPKMRWGQSGQLDVIVDGTVVFSKQKSGRIPTAEEIVKIVKPV
jgi:predicted Rdx family selenoprotein